MAESGEYVYVVLKIDTARIDVPGEETEVVPENENVFTTVENAKQYIESVIDDAEWMGDDDWYENREEMEPTGIYSWKTRKGNARNEEFYGYRIEKFELDSMTRTDTKDRMSWRNEE